MGVVKKQSVKASIITYIGVLIGVLNVFIIFPYFLSKEQIGLIKSLEAIALIIVPFIYIGFPHAVNKFFPVYKESDFSRYKSGMTYLFIVMAINTLIATVVFFFLKDYILSLFNDKSPLLSKYMLFVIPIFIGISWFSIFFGISTSNLKIVMPRLLERILIRIIQMAIVLLFYFSFISELSMVSYIALSYLMIMVLQYLYVKREGMLEFDYKHFITSKIAHDEEKHYVGMLTLSTISDSLISNIGVVIIGTMLGLEYAAIFFIAYYMGYILEVPATNFSLILKPVLADSLEKGDDQNVLKLYKKSSLLQTIISGFLFILLFANINEIFSIMPNGANFVEGKWVVIIISLGFVIKNMAGCHFDILTMSKHYRYSVAVTIIMAILTCVSFILSINFFGFLGAAIASVTTIILHSLFVVIIVYSLLKILPVDKQTLQLGMVLLLIFILSIFLPSLQNSYLSILYKSSLLVCIYLPVIYILGISEDINQQIKRILNAL